MQMSLNPVAPWAENIRQAFLAEKPILLIDDIDDQTRGAVVFPAQLASPSLINFCIHLSHGASTMVAISAERADIFQLERMGFNRSTEGAQIDPIELGLVSVEARAHVTTGISAADRATTVRLLGSAQPSARDIVKPGHVFPVQTKSGGVLVRSAVPEGALDSVHAAGFEDAACFFELLSSTGEYLHQDELKSLAEAEGLIAISLNTLITNRLSHEQLVQRIAEVKLPTHFNPDMRAYLYRSHIHIGDHLALVKGNIDPEKPVLTRVQPERTFADVFGLVDRDGTSRSAIQSSLEAISQAECGVLIYLRRPDSTPLIAELTGGSSLAPKKGTAMKEYGLGAQILRDLGVRNIDLLSSSGAPEVGLASFGLTITRRQPLRLTLVSSKEIPKRDVPSKDIPSKDS